MYRHPSVRMYGPHFVSPAGENVQNSTRGVRSPLVFVLKVACDTCVAPVSVVSYTVVGLDRYEK